MNYLIVGLGNPGKNFERTKHNVGYFIIDRLITSLNLKLDKSKFDGIYTVLKFNENNFYFCKPETYMNNSGLFVCKLAKYFNVKVENIIIIYDDLDLSIGQMKIRHHGRSNGHRGLQNIFDCFQSENIPRIKIGIGRPENKDISIKNYVLSFFSRKDLNKLEKNIEKIILIIKDYLNNPNIDILMNKYNGK